MVDDASYIFEPCILVLVVVVYSSRLRTEQRKQLQIQTLSTGLLDKTCALLLIYVIK